MMRAIINEDICIGCTKCIPVCPTDAIIGATKLMHTVIEDACVGCGLCLPPCPMDCIVMIPIPEPTTEVKKENAIRWRERYKKRKMRLEKNKQQAEEQYARNKESRQQTMQAALLRIQHAKNTEI